MMKDIKLQFIDDDNRGQWLSELDRYFSEDIQVPNKAERIAEITVIGLEQKRIVCVGTRYLQYNSEFREWFWYYRCSVSQSYRCQGLAKKMVLLVHSTLEKRYVLGGPIGLFYEIENIRMNARQSIIWPSGAVFLGFDAKGRQKRCLYFTHALLGQADSQQVKI